jgi:GNAT superfamily N-acetyltransferase
VQDVGVTLRVTEEPIAGLDEHAGISIAFMVERILLVSAPGSGLGGVVFDEVPVERPWVKDYDTIKGEGPTRWPKRFDVSNWGLIAAHDNDVRLGGVVVAFNTGGVHMLEGGADIAVLWDLRIQPEFRNSGVGSKLFRAAEEWSRERGCRVLKVETQNVNLPACRFYVRMGCDWAQSTGAPTPTCRTRRS